MTETSDNAAPMAEPRNRPATLAVCAPRPVMEIRAATLAVADVNPAFCRLAGTSREALLGRTFGEILPAGCDGGPVFERISRSGEPGPEGDLESARWLHVLWPALDSRDPPMTVTIEVSRAGDFHQTAAEINEALLIAGLHQHELTAEAVKLNALLQKEIAERQLAEAALRVANERLADQTVQLEHVVDQRTEKLRETVGELEAFSYSVAHDMRTPLRGMQGFAQILLDQYAGQLDAAGRGYLERIASSAVRMDALIQDVLHYTRVLRGDAILRPVDVDRLVRDLLAIHPDWQLPKADIRIEGELPRVTGHDGLLAQCFSNLLSNAVKFVAPGITPRVRIRAAEAPASPGGRVVRIWVENNGIGIAEKDHGRVFRMFERLNPANQFEGTGIGLTIASKAVHRMGGRIDFDSESGKGSRFWIDLNRAIPASQPGADTA